MTTGWKIYWLLVLATVGIGLVMTFWTIPLIAQSAGGLAPFDVRPTGYSFEDAQQFLSALTVDGLSVYQRAQYQLDTAFPVLQGLVLVIALRWFSQTWHVLARVVLVVFPIIGAVADYLENSAVLEMLVAGAEQVTPEMVATANGWTVIKSTTITVSMVALLGFLLMALVRRLRSGKAS